MARIAGVEKGGSLIARIAFFMCQRKVGRVIRPVRVHALHTRLLMGYGQMEAAQEKAARVPRQLKCLAEVRVAMQIGCPF